MAEFIYGYRYKNNGQQFNVTVARFIFSVSMSKHIRQSLIKLFINYACSR